MIKNTGLREDGVLSECPLTIADIGHNKQAFEFISQKLKKQTIIKAILYWEFQMTKTLNQSSGYSPKNEIHPYSAQQSKS